jgi:dCTP deaminase
MSLIDMSFISWKTMKDLILNEKLIENSPKDKYWTNKSDFSGSGASVDLRLGPQVFVTPMKTPINLGPNQIINIDPGQFAALLTEDILNIPERFIGFITIRLHYKSKGLVNISGFHVDPGFKGRLIFSVYNAGPTTVTLQRGQPIFSLFLAHIEKGALYTGEYQNLDGIPLKIIEPLAGARVPSIQELESKVKRSETLLAVYGTILGGIVVSLIAALITGALKLG